MSEAIVQPVLASTTVTEDVRDFQLQLRNFYERNHTPIIVLGVVALGLFINRRMLRQELTRLHFSVEVVSDGNLVDLDKFDYLDND